MPDQALLALTWRVTRRRLATSPLALAAGLAFPGLVVWIGINESYASAAKFFFFLLPHVFLIAAQDAVRSDLDSGALESVLFLGGRFRGFLEAKSRVLAAAATGYAMAVFGLLAAWGAAVGAFEWDLGIRFGLALLAGFTYVAWAGVLSHFLKAGSNVLVLLLAQAAAVVGLIVSTSARTGLLDYAASGHFPGLRPKLAFGALVALIPNLVVSGRMPYFAAEVAVLLGLGLFVLRRLTARVEIRK